MYLFNKGCSKTKVSKESENHWHTHYSGGLPEICTKQMEDIRHEYIVEKPSLEIGPRLLWEYRIRSDFEIMQKAGKLIYKGLSLVCVRAILGIGSTSRSAYHEITLRLTVLLLFVADLMWLFPNASKANKSYESFKEPKASNLLHCLMSGHPDEKGFIKRLSF